MKLVFVLLLRQFRVIFIEMILWRVALCSKRGGGFLKVEGFEVLTMVSVAGKGGGILPFLIRVLLT